jgi:hypothetical protein
MATVSAGAASGVAQVLQNGALSNPVAFTINTPQITTVTPNSGSAGASITITGSGFGTAQGSGIVWLGSAPGAVVSWSDTQIVAAVDPASVTGIARVQQNGIWSNTVKFTVPPQFSETAPVTITPSLASLVVGDTITLQALDSSGQAVTGLTWASSDTTIATVSTDDPPVITAIAPGHVSVTAGNASADITVYAGPELPLGTVKWSAPGDGSGVAQIIPAVPSDTGVADVFAWQNSGQLQAITAEGKVAWTANVGRQPAQSLIPDFQGGVISATPQSVMRFDGMTGQPQGLYFSTDPSGAGIGSVVPHTDGTIFAIDGDALVGINPADGTPKFSVPMNERSTTDTTNFNGFFGVFCASFADSDATQTHSEEPSNISNMIVAGDGYAYVAYWYSTDTYTNFQCADYSSHRELHLGLLRVSSSGDWSKIMVKDWTADHRVTFSPSNPWAAVSTQNGVIPSLQVAGLITNADQGVLLSWGTASDAYCAYGDPSGQSGCVAKATQLAVTPVTNGSVGQDGIIAISNQSNPVWPLLQASDGTYFGTAYGPSDPSTGEPGANLIVAFDQAGHLKYSLPGDDYWPDHVDATDNLVAWSDSREALLTFDSSGNAIGQSANGLIQSWTGSGYQYGSVESLAQTPFELSGSFGALVGGNHSGSGTAIQQVLTNQPQGSDDQLPPAGATLHPTYHAIELLTSVPLDTLFARYIEAFGGAQGTNNDVTDAFINTQTGTITAVGQKITFVLHGVAALGQGPFSVRINRLDPASHTMVAVTQKGHPLDGWRYWRVFSVGTNDIVIETGAADRPHPGPLNYIGYYLANGQLRVWQEFLQFIRRDLHAAQGSNPQYNLVKGTRNYDLTYILQEMCLGCP